MIVYMKNFAFMWWYFIYQVLKLYWKCYACGREMW